MNHRTLTVSMISAALLLGLAPLAGAADTTPMKPAAAAVPVSGLTTARQKIAARDFTGAIPLLNAAITANANDADALNLMGFSLRKSGHPTEALAYYNRALALQPKHLGANEYLGELYVELGQPDKARERLAVLEATCGKNCDETRDLAAALAKAAQR